MKYLFLTKRLTSTGHKFKTIKSAKMFIDHSLAVQNAGWILVKNSDYIKNELHYLNPYKNPIVNMHIIMKASD